MAGASANGSAAAAAAVPAPAGPLAGFLPAALESNPYFSAGFGLTLMGVGLALARRGGALLQVCLPTGSAEPVGRCLTLSRAPRWRRASGSPSRSR